MTAGALRSRLAPAGAGAALSLVHGLHPGDRDLVALGDQVSGKRLRLRHRLGPRVGVAETVERGVHGEVRRANVAELVQVVESVVNDKGEKGSTR